MEYYDEVSLYGGVVKLSTILWMFLAVQGSMGRWVRRSWWVRWGLSFLAVQGVTVLMEIISNTQIFYNYSFRTPPPTHTGLLNLLSGGGGSPMSRGGIFAKLLV